jgi:hypothetical protein
LVIRLFVQFLSHSMAFIMKKLVSFVIWALAASVSIAFADLFPVREGNWWNFSFIKTIDGLEGSEIDSGAILWRIIQIIPGDDALYLIKIQQQRDLVRSMNNYINPVDSVFDPPRTTFDTLTLPANYLSNGLTFTNDSCIALLHEPQCAAGQCTLSTAQIQYHGKTITGYIVDPLPCRSKGASNPDCIASDRFTLADGIGPVAFKSGWSPCTFDLFVEEQWTLIDHHASDRWISPDTVAAGTLTTLTLSTLEYVFEPGAFVKNIAMGSNGILLTYMPVYDPSVRLAALYGHGVQIRFQLTAPAAGKYPVIAERLPMDCPTCGVSLPDIECIDTLVVTGPASIKGRVINGASGPIASARKINGTVVLYYADNFNGKEARLLDARGRLLARACVNAGKAVFNTRPLSPGKVVFISIGNKVAWRCVIQ